MQVHFDNPELLVGLDGNAGLNLTTRCATRLGYSGRIRRPKPDYNVGGDPPYSPPPPSPPPLGTETAPT
jgi:hypothetical protein